MSTEYIRAVSIRRGQVYLTSKSSNVMYLYTRHCESLSKVYGEEGQPGLDREILRMLCEYAVLKGHHPSLERYRHALEAPEKEKIFQETAQALQAAYDLLQSEDQAHPLTAQSEAARAYRLTARKLPGSAIHSAGQAVPVNARGRIHSQTGANTTGHNRM